MTGRGRARWLEPAVYVETIAREGTSLLEAASVDLDARCPSCPGWSVRDLVEHTGAVLRHKTATVRHGGTTRPEIPRERGPTGSVELLRWFQTAVDDAVAVLRDTDPEAPAYSFAGDHRVAWWQRRLAHEVVIHRWDAEAAVGRPAPVAPARLAADGIDELLDVHVGGIVRYDGPDGRFRIVPTDAVDGWVVRLGSGTVTATREPGLPAEPALRGPASDLDLILWRRLPPDAVQRLGDQRAVEAFLAWLDVG